MVQLDDKQIPEAPTNKNCFFSPDYAIVVFLGIVELLWFCQTDALILDLCLMVPTARSTMRKVFNTN